MYNTSELPQVKYSLDCLSEALFDLMKKKDLEDISIVELCRRAQVARKTFYRNCEEKTDIVAYQIDKQVDALLVGVDWNCTDAELLYHGFFSFWWERKEFLQILYKQSLFERFCQCMANRCIEGFRYQFLEDFVVGKEDAAVLRRYHHSFVIGGLCKMLEYWTKERFAVPVETLVCVAVHLAPEYRK